MTDKCAATNCSISTFKATGSVQSSAMSRSRHIARCDITSLKLVFANWVCDWHAGVRSEAGTGATMTLSAAVEYNGVNYPVRWSGSSNVAIPDGTTSAESDAVTVTIPNGAAFFVRSYYQIPGNVVICDTGTGVNAALSPAASGGDEANGEKLYVGGTTQVSGTGGLAANGTQAVGLCFRPVAITSPSATKAWLLLGDSRQQGYSDAYTGTSSDKGQLARSVGPYSGYCNAGVPSDSASIFVSSHAKRVGLAPYFTHVVCEYGTNDTATRTATQIQNDLTAIASYFAIPVYQTTFGPRTTSTDAWATTANQTAYAQNSVKNTVNAAIRAGLSGMAGHFEIADIVESARDSGKWAVNGSANYFTNDGIHEVNTANIAIAALAVPGTPEIGAATVVDEAHVSVTFTPGAAAYASITRYVVRSDVDGFSASGSGSPIVMPSDFVPSRTYQFSVTAETVIGPSAASAFSNAVIPNPAVDGGFNVLQEDDAAILQEDGTSTIQAERPTSTGFDILQEDLTAIRQEDLASHIQLEHRPSVERGMRGVLRGVFVGGF
jgi:hypothetical protein